ncbi:MAG: hypothetical protein R3F59_22380 [Myxococcota bacterium]
MPAAPDPSPRFDPGAAAAMRDAIREAGGVEVFAVGDVELGHVVAVTVTCRGTEDRVPGLIDRPRAGQVVIHNHPSGDLRPSEADLQLAHLYGEDGVGVVIVDSDVTRSNWVVEPHVRAVVPVDDTELVRFFREGLPKALPGWEARDQQLEMARHVAAALDRGEPLLCEAGTGTGKSLAYLVPAALWALANESKVVVSTFTRALQAQLVSSDLPLLLRGGIDARTAVLQGRSNYLCKRRLGLALEDTEGDDRAALEALAQWSENTQDGSRSDLPFAVDPTTWEHVLSDSELTLSIRCPHYEGCHYYRARRAASGAHVVVVNHALLLTDLQLRAEAGRGFLPRYERVILDEGHHLRRRRHGRRVHPPDRHLRPPREPHPARRPQAQGRAGRARARPRRHRAGRAAARGPPAPARRRRPRRPAPGGARGERRGRDEPDRRRPAAQPGRPHRQTQPARRITPALADSEAWQLDVDPLLRRLGAELTATAEALDGIVAAFDGAVLPEARPSPCST